MVLGEISHGTLGRVVVTARRNTTRASARWRRGMVSLNVPQGSRLPQIRRVLDELAPRLLAARPAVEYADGSQVRCPGLVISVRRQRLAPDRVLGTASLPLSSVEVGARLDLDDPATQVAVSDMMLKIARRLAPALLLPAARALAERVGRRPAGWRVSTGHRVLGTCDSDGYISLSYILVFLPAELREYVICHELAHLSELNHSPRFHALLDGYLGGREAALVARLRRFPWPVFRR